MLSNTLLCRFTQMQFDSKRLLLLPVMALLLGCGTKPSAFEAEPPKESFRTGTLLVGEDIVPGRYFTNPKAGCYFARLSGLGGELSDIIANEFIGFDAVQWIVEIDPADLAFSTDAECGEWSKNPTAGMQVGISPGAWLVNQQIQPGRYRALNSAGCYWERLSNFGGGSSGRIANDFIPTAGQALVEISSTDLGFSADAECGQWVAF